MSTVKDAISQAVDRLADELYALSTKIHDNPELAYQEVKACAWLTEFLGKQGFKVEPGVGGVETAFRATIETGEGPTVAILCEYDALPGIGHACGHNIIAATSVGAGIAAARVADDVGLTITVVGTPAEESGGGKALLLERGAFAGVHGAMMVHPAPVDAAEPPTLAWSQFDVRYTGKAAHAAATYIVRARTVPELDDIRTRILRCFEAGAVATGAALEIRPSGPLYAEVRHDRALAAVYRRNAEALGRSFPDLGALLERSAASTDMGNVSHALPGIHPIIGIDSLPAVNHQPEFAAHCIGAAADRALADGALALAWTAIDVAGDEALSSRLRAR